MPNLKGLVNRFLSVLDIYGVVDIDEDKDYKDDEKIYFHLENPEDEDYTVSLRYGNILKDIKAEYESFDLDENVSMLLDNRGYIYQVLENIYFLCKKADVLLNEDNKEHLIDSIIECLDNIGEYDLSDLSDSYVEDVIYLLGLGFISVDDSYFRECFIEAVAKAQGRQGVVSGCDVKFN